jgi:hypothetical protein
MSDPQDVLTGPDAGPDAQYERFSRARFYTVAAAVAALLTCWYMVNNVFLAPVAGIAGALCSWRGIRNDGNRWRLLVLLAICLLPALIAVVALLLLLPNLPSLSFSDVKIVKS